MINMLIGPIANLAGTWFKGKAEQRAAETKVKIARAEAEATIMVSRATSEAEWYQYTLGVIVAASFGVRSATKFFGK